MPRFVPSGLGWVQDLTDPRDLTQDDDFVGEQLKHLGEVSGTDLPSSVDLSDVMPPVIDQAGLNCSSVCAVLGLVDYFERLSRGCELDGSTIFLYKAARCLERIESGNIGIGIRSTLKALRRFGTPPRDLWEEDPSDFDRELNCTVAAGYAQDFYDLSYFRLRPKTNEENGASTLHLLKLFLAAGFPVATGFSLPASIENHPEIPFRPAYDALLTGQAAVAVGYDDLAPTTPRGAIRVRLSWGQSWGENGYGWLPYPYVVCGWATDFWTVMRPDWLTSNELTNPFRP